MRRGYLGTIMDTLRTTTVLLCPGLSTLDLELTRM